MKIQGVRILGALKYSHVLYYHVKLEYPLNPICVWTWFCLSVSVSVSPPLPLAQMPTMLSITNLFHTDTHESIFFFFLSFFSSFLTLVSKCQRLPNGVYRRAQLFEDTKMFCRLSFLQHNASCYVESISRESNNALSGEDALSADSTCTFCCCWCFVLFLCCRFISLIHFLAAGSSNWLSRSNSLDLTNTI